MITLVMSVLIMISLVMSTLMLSSTWATCFGWFENPKKKLK